MMLKSPPPVVRAAATNGDCLIDNTCARITRAAERHMISVIATMMVVVLHFPVHIAVATSQVVVAGMAAQSTATHVLRGSLGIDETMGQALLLAVGALPGAQVGALLARRFAGAAITRVLAASVLLVGVRLAYGAITG